MTTEAETTGRYSKFREPPAWVKTGAEGIVDDLQAGSQRRVILGKVMPTGVETLIAGTGQRFGTFSFSSSDELPDGMLWPPGWKINPERRRLVLRPTGSDAGATLTAETRLLIMMLLEQHQSEVLDAMRTMDSERMPEHFQIIQEATAAIENFKAFTS